jgi:hypothetical protein
MIGDLEVIVHVNLTEFSCGRLLIAEIDLRPIGQYLRVWSQAVLRDHMVYIDFDATNS